MFNNYATTHAVTRSTQPVYQLGSSAAHRDILPHSCCHLLQFNHRQYLKHSTRSLPFLLRDDCISEKACFHPQRIHVFFFLIIRRPPSSPLFPSPPLFRSKTAVGKYHRVFAPIGVATRVVPRVMVSGTVPSRSAGGGSVVVSSSGQRAANSS